MERIRNNDGYIYIGIKYFGIIMNMNNVKMKYKFILYCVLLFEYIIIIIKKERSSKIILFIWN